MNTLTHFQQSLDAELRERAALPPSEPAPSPARRARPTRRILLATGTAVAAVAVAVAVPLSTGGGTEAAFALTPHPDGTVTVSLGMVDAKSFPAFQASLRKLGIPAAAMVATPGCTTKFPADRTQVHQVVITVVPGPTTLVIRPSAIPRGATLLFALTRLKEYVVNTDRQGKTTVKVEEGGTGWQFGLMQKMPSCIAGIPGTDGQLSLLPTGSPSSK